MSKELIIKTLIRTQNQQLLDNPLRAAGRAERRRVREGPFA